MHRLKLIVAAIGIAFFSLFNFSCTKIDSTTIGGGLLPPGDNVVTKDTVISVLANNYDSVNVDCPKIYPGDDRPLGYISNDPYFGSTRATVYTEFKPAVFPFSFHAGSSRSLDSVVLILKYKRTYGDSSKPLKLKVFQVTDANLVLDSSTCTFHDFDVPLLGSVTYTPANMGDTTPLRINLGTSLQALFLRDSSFLTDSAFKKAFHGFAIAPDITFPGSNSISYINVNDTNTKLAVYYKYIDSTGPPAKPAVSNFVVSNSSSSYSQSASYVTRSRTGAEINNFTGPIPNAAGDTSIYLQTSPGTFALIRIPALANVSNRIIHRAELIIDQVYSPAPSNLFFSTPNYLFLDIKDSGNASHLELCDFSFSSSTGPNLSQFGGYRTYVKDYLGRDIVRYVFNISRYVQKIVTQQVTPRVFRLYSPSLVTSGTTLLSDPLCNSGVVSYPAFLLNQPVAGRVKLYGGNSANATNKMRLHIVYSKL